MEKKCGLLSAESLEYIDLQWKRSKIIHSMNVCFLKLFYFWLHWIFVLHAAFSTSSEQGLLSRWCVGFLLQLPLLFRSTASRARGLRACRLAGSGAGTQ